MKTVENLNMRYTNKHADNETIFQCQRNWAACDLHDFAIFIGADDDSLEMVANWLRDECAIAHGKSLEIWFD